MWNDPQSKQHAHRGEFNWQEVIENTKDLLDEEEKRNYLYRKDRMTHVEEDDDGGADLGKRRQRKQVQKNQHLIDKFDFTTDFN